METPTTIIAGVFEQQAQARRALDALKQAGFGYDQVGVAAPGKQGIDLKNDLLGLGVPQQQANYYAQELAAGRTVVSVRPDGQEQQVHDLLHNYGAYDYEHQTAETQTAAGYTRSSATVAQADASAQNAVSDVQDDYHQPRSLKLRAERLNVSKDRVQTGEVGLHKEVVSEQKTIDVPVTREEVVVERRAITDGNVDTSPIGEGETIRVPVSEEQVNVTKNTVETGEVAIGKRNVQETQRVSDTVRREEARVEQEGDAPIHGTKSDRFHPDSVDKDTL
jgi:uncharacterized protein (TIGR02271 family)